MVEIIGKPRVLHILDCLYRGEGNVTKTNKQTTSGAQVLTEIQMTIFRILKRSFVSGRRKATSASELF